MPMKRLLFSISLLSMLLMLTCSRSVEGETSAWKRNQTQVQDLISLYPGFQKPLQERLSKAEAAWNDAQSVSDEEKKIEAMAAANRLLTSDFIGQLKDFDRDKKKLQDLVLDAQGAGKDRSDQQMADAARQQANSAIQEADSRLRQGATSIAAANTVLRKIDGDFNAATKGLKKVISVAKKKQKQADKEKSDQLDKEKEAKKALTWKCSYCGKVNDSKHHECTGCGAGKES